VIRLPASTPYPAQIIINKIKKATAKKSFILAKIAFIAFILYTMIHKRKKIGKNSKRKQLSDQQKDFL
jgi:hypothetical protein